MPPADPIQAADRDRPSAGPTRIRTGLHILSAVASRFVGKALGLAFVVVAARLASPEDFAAYSYLTVAAITVAAVMDAGTGVAAGRDVASSQLQLAQAYRAALPSTLVAGLLGAVAMVILGALDSAPGSSGWPVAFAALYVALNAPRNLQCALLRNSGRHWVESGLQVLAGASFLLAGSVALLMDGSVGAVMAVFAIKEVVILAIGQAFLPLPRVSHRRAGATWSVLRAGLAISIASTMLAVTLRWSTLVLGNTGSVRAIGDYSVASRFADVFFLAAQAIGIGIAPRLYAGFASPSTAARIRAREVVLFSLAAAWFAVLPLWLFTPEIGLLIFGREFAGAEEAIVILAFSLPAFVVLFLCWQMLIAQRREGYLVLATGITCAVALATTPWIESSPSSTTAAAAALTAFATLAVLLVAPVMVVRGTRGP